MKQYTIYCTEAQTRKAFELGAPILNYPIQMSPYGVPKYERQLPSGKWIAYILPTTEQMIEWLEERGITIEMVKCDMYWFGRAYSDENTYFNKGRFVSRKEAALAAIDAALEYLNEKHI